MEINVEHILLFKTDIRTEADKREVATLMQAMAVTEWTVDQDDIDCVLRIVSDCLKLDDVIRLLVNNGYECEELT